MQFIREVIPINDVYPLRKPRSKRVTWRPDRLRRKRVMVARYQEHRRMRASEVVESLRESLPEVLGWRGIIEQVASTQHGVHGVTSCDV